MSVPWYLMAKGKGGGGYKTASGPIVSINDALAAPLRSLVANIEPVQAGSGDPSPDNVRPISGWSAVNVWRTGKNLLDCRVQTQHDVIGTKNADGSYHIEGTATLTAYPVNFIRIVLKPGVYVFSISNLPSGVSCAYTLDGAWAGSVTQGKTVTLTKERVLSGYIAVTTGTTVNTDITLQLEVGSLPTAYEPYQGNTYTIQLGQTVYGGTLDVTNGVLTVDRGIYIPTGNESSYTQQTGRVAFALPNDFRVPGTVERICSDFKILTASTYCYVYTTLTPDELKNYFQQNTVQMVLGLATPITIPLTPQEISTLQGKNNVWADTGDVTVEYLSAGGANPDLMKLAVAFMGRK